MPQQKTWAEISASALRANLKAIRGRVTPAKVMTVVKSNAYGHGAVIVAKAIAAQTDWFGVDDIDEALTLRKNGIRKPIFVLGYTPLNRLADCATHRISFVAYNRETLTAIKKIKAKKGAFKIHIPIETGTTRQGIASTELRAFVHAAQQIPSIQIEGIYTHFANIEDTTDSSYAMGQLRKYNEARKELDRMGVKPKIRHTAASAGALLYPQTRFDLVRTGIALYGHWPSENTQHGARGVRLNPVLTWKTIVAQVKQVRKGTPVSYGLTERVKHDSVIAVLPIGYWDGYDRRGLSSVAHVLIRGKRCKVVGRVCMNMIMVDVTNVPGVKPEDEVVLIGKQGRETITAEELAEHIGTIQYEVLTRINPTIERKLVK